MIRDSRWDRNGAGILSNSYANEAHAPQRRATIVRNRPPEYDELPKPPLQPRMP